MRGVSNVLDILHGGVYAVTQLRGKWYKLLPVCCVRNNFGLEKMMVAWVGGSDASLALAPGAFRMDIDVALGWHDTLTISTRRTGSGNGYPDATQHCIWPEC